MSESAQNEPSHTPIAPAGEGTGRRRVSTMLGLTAIALITVMQSNHDPEAKQKPASRTQLAKQDPSADALTLDKARMEDAVDAFVDRCDLSTCLRLAGSLPSEGGFSADLLRSLAGNMPYEMRGELITIAEVISDHPELAREACRQLKARMGGCTGLDHRRLMASKIPGEDHPAFDDPERIRDAALEYLEFERECGTLSQSVNQKLAERRITREVVKKD